MPDSNLNDCQPEQSAPDKRAERLQFVAITVPVVAGFTAMAGQIVLLREVLVLFNGNELSMGIVLAAWMVWTAAGSSAVSRMIRNRADVRVPLIAVEFLCSVSLVPTLWSLRVARAYLQTVPGELLGPVPIALVSWTSMSVFCVLSGGMFSLAAQLFQQPRAPSREWAISYAYLFETVGAALGGIATSVLLLRFFGSFQIAIVAALLNLYVVSALIFKTPHRRAATAISATALAFALIVYAAPRMEASSQRKIWSGFELIGSQDSIYGRLTLLSTGGLRSIYDNGSIVANVPDVAAAEETIHYALLEHPAPRRVLLIGGGLNGSIAEAFKHPTLASLDYVELDPAVIEIYRKYFPRESASALSDPRVHVHSVDGRLYLKASSQHFDEIILSVSEPENAQLNRFYTAEFFRLARDHLAPGGVFALQLHSSEDSIGPELADFLRCIFHSLQGVFPSASVIPGETIHMFGAVQPGLLTEAPELLAARLRDRGLQTLYVRAYSIPLRMMPDRMEQIHALLSPLNNTPTNHDFHPVAYYFGAVLWSAQFRSAYARALEVAARVRFSSVLAAVAALSILLLFAWVAAPNKRAQGAAVWNIVATGYTLMALQILLLLTFQSVYGYVYHELALLMGMFMAGMALGSWLGITRIRTAKFKSLLETAAINQMLLAVSAPLLLLLVSVLSTAGTGNALWVAGIAFPVLAVLCGMPGGFQFPIASAIYRQARPAQTNVSTLYACDLLGGCICALLLAGFLIPVYGCWNTAGLTAMLSVVPAILPFLASRNSMVNSNE